MNVFRFAARLAAVLLAAAAPFAQGATLNIDIPGCSAVAMTGTPPNYQVTCTQQNQTCTVLSTPTSPNGGTEVTLIAACNPAAGSVTWQASRDCTVPTIQAGQPLTAKVTEPAGGRSCIYTATAAGTVPDGGGMAATTVVWQGPGTLPPPNAPSGCAIARTPANGSLASAGGAISMSGACSGGGAVSNWYWRKNATNNWATLQAPNDTLPANTSATAVTYTYGLTACSGTACATEVVTTFTVAASAAVPVGFCAGLNNVVIVDIPISGSTPTAANGGFQADGIFVGRMVIPANVNTAGIGKVKFVEFQDGPAGRQMTVSRSACDFRGQIVGRSIGQTDPTSTNFPIMWASDQTPAILYQFTGSSLTNAVLQAGQTYFFNIRNVNWESGSPSCTNATGTCNGLINSDSP